MSPARSLTRSAGVLPPSAGRGRGWVEEPRRGSGAGGGPRRLCGALGWCLAGGRGVRPVLVVEATPRLKPAWELGGLEARGRPELLESDALGPLDLTVQVRGTGPVGPELDAPVTQPVLDLVGVELPTSIGLDALHGKGHVSAHPLKEVERAGGVSVRVDAQHLPAGAGAGGGGRWGG